MEELILEGRKYLGRFKAESKDESYMFRGDTHSRHNYWWEGQCDIKDLDVDEKRIFLFNTRNLSRRIGSLKEAVVSFASRTTSYPNQPKIQNHVAIFDLILEKMYLHAKEQMTDSEVIIPSIVVPQLCIEELTENGLIK